MGKFVDGFWIIHYGLGGELQREFAESTDDARTVFLGMIKDTELADGDTFKIETGESER